MHKTCLIKSESKKSRWTSTKFTKNLPLVPMHCFDLFGYKWNKFNVKLTIKPINSSSCSWRIIVRYCSFTLVTKIHDIKIHNMIAMYQERYQATVIHLTRIYFNFISEDWVMRTLQLCVSTKVEIGNENLIHFLLSFISSLALKPLFMHIEANIEVSISKY